MKRRLPSRRIFLKSALLLIPVFSYRQMFWGVEEIPMEWTLDNATLTSISSKLPTKYKSSVKKAKDKNIHALNNREMV